MYLGNNSDYLHPGIFQHTFGCKTDAHQEYQSCLSVSREE